MAEVSAEPSISRLSATVADESAAEEIEAAVPGGDPAAPTAASSATANGTEAKVEVEGRANGTIDGDGSGEAKKEEVGGEAVAEAQTEEVEDPDRIPDDACETLYLQNLNEKVRIPVMKETLALLFKPYRPILPVVAHRNVRMRGQAFVTFNDVENANKARREVAEFPLYGKAIQISFARGRSDSAVKKLAGDEAFEEHKKKRLEEKKIKRRDNPLRRKAAEKLKAEDTGAPAAKKQRLQMPDEYLPPNSVLFIQNLPEGTTSDDLREVFELHPGLVEIRTIPAKKDIAFVEFGDEAAATIAKEALHNFKIDGETKMKVTYARK